MARIDAPDHLSFIPVGDDGLAHRILRWNSKISTVPSVTAAYWAYIDFTRQYVHRQQLRLLRIVRCFHRIRLRRRLELRRRGLRRRQRSRRFRLGDYNVDIVDLQRRRRPQVLDARWQSRTSCSAGNVYYDVYWNGDKLWGIDTWNISGGDAEVDALQDRDPHQLAQQRRSRRPTSAGRHSTSIALALDYFYGLKEDKKVETVLRHSGRLCAFDRRRIRLRDVPHDFRHRLQTRRFAYLPCLHRIL
ncbi:MAG: hypothetical protein MZU97_18265 [Bacillus subtilis]|nr:hypothetical protein [Bacillus subtilis]